MLLVDLPFFGAGHPRGADVLRRQPGEQGASWWQRIKYLPFVMALGIGLSVNNARAVVEALMGHETGFVRTPKSGVRPVRPPREATLPAWP